MDSEFVKLNGCLESSDHQSKLETAVGVARKVLLVSFASWLGVLVDVQVCALPVISRLAHNQCRFIIVC